MRIRGAVKLGRANNVIKECQKESQNEGKHTQYPNRH